MDEFRYVKDVELNVKIPPKPSFFGCDNPAPLPHRFFSEPHPHTFTIPERLEENAQNLKEVVERLRCFEDALYKRYDNLMSVLTQDNTLFKQVVNDRYNDFLALAQAEIKTFEANIQATLALFETAKNEELTAHLERIVQAELYMRENLNNTLTNLLHEMEANGALAGVIDSDIVVSVKQFGAKGD